MAHCATVEDSSKQPLVYNQDEDNADAFFAAAPPLKDHNSIKQNVETFVAQHSGCSGGQRSRLICITSGGTTVPLERRCVRFIDNFSSGHRGAASTEYFLKSGYAVIFLYRRGTIQPFCRYLPEDPLLECFETNGSGGIKTCSDYSNCIEQAVKDNYMARNEGRLLKVPYVTLFEYLQILYIIATAMQQLEKHAMFYLAAAVADFYVPWDTMVEHKIQSASGPLAVQLSNVPKMLTDLRQIWAPQAFCISFKLETDMDILIKKAVSAQKKYGVHAVVANELMTRKQKVIIILPQGHTIVERTDPNQDLEICLVKILVDKHTAYIEGHKS